MSFHVPEEFRVTTGPTRTKKSDGNNGHFFVRSLKFKMPIFCQASDGGGWEHVSASIRNRCPTWDEMCKVKSLFWDDEDLVAQYHLPKSKYVNNHPYVLHLWRKAGSNNFVEMPPIEYV